MMKTTTVHHMVKSEDLNHHGTLFAGRNAEWFVEAGFIAAAGLLPPQNIVCINIHGMSFRRPVAPGEITRFNSQVVYAGRTSLVVHVCMDVNEQEVVRGFITFVHVNEAGCPAPHGLVIAAATSAERDLQDQARSLPKT